jgi:sugar/nucleoside kinase (ribokinase family)
MRGAAPRFLVAGRLTRDYLVLPTGEPQLDIPGGSALYATVGLLLWEPDPPPAIIARVGEDYPQEWLDDFSHCGLNVSGVHVLPEAVDLRSFTAFVDRSTRAMDEPVAHFARLGLPFPRALLGYKTPAVGVDSRTRLLPTSLRQADFPPEFMGAGAIHFCPLDYLAHSLLPTILRQAEFTAITLDPSPGYMNPTFWENVPTIITGLTAFIPSEEEIRSLFQSRSDDLREMAETLASYGCSIIVIKRGERGQLLYDAAGHNLWEVPAYPARMVNPIGAGDAFCGGFLAGFRRTYDPLQAVLYGNVSASFVVEGHRATYALDVLPGLPQARLKSLQQSVRKV